MIVNVSIKGTEIRLTGDMRAEHPQQSSTASILRDLGDCISLICAHSSMPCKRVEETDDRIVLQVIKGVPEQTLDSIRQQLRSTFEFTGVEFVVEEE